MSDIQEKWGREVAERGFAQVPNYLLLLNNFTDEDARLSPVELLVLIQLVGAWWDKDDLPFPSMATLAARSGVSERQVQRAVARLIKDEIIGRVKRRSKGIVSTNAYDMQPLVALLSEVAKKYPNAYPRSLSKKASIKPVKTPPTIQRSGQYESVGPRDGGGGGRESSTTKGEPLPPIQKADKRPEAVGIESRRLIRPVSRAGS